MFKCLNVKFCSQSSCPNLTASTHGERRPLQVQSHLRFKSMSFKVQSQSKVIFSKLGSPIRLQIIQTCLFILLSASPSRGPQTSFTPFLLILIGSQILIYRSDSNCHTETFLFKAGAQSTKTVQCQANFAR